MILHKDFKEFIQLLEKFEVQYLIVGGYALAYHGYPRFTQDIDFWIFIQKENAIKIIQVIRAFGFASLDLNEHDFLVPENVIQLGFPPNRIDILTEIDGVSFEKAYPSRKELKLDDLSIQFIGLDELIQNKKSSGRLQDLADIEMLEKIKEERK